MAHKASWIKELETWGRRMEKEYRDRLGEISTLRSEASKILEFNDKKDQKISELQD